MLIAKNEDQESIYAEPKLTAFCPGCGNEVIPKCGKVVMWHWAHKIKSNCVYEPETQWHLRWKKLAIDHGLDIEVKYVADEVYVADAVDEKNKRVIEFQHSSINVRDIIDRCEFYERLGYKIDWVFDYKDKDLHFNGSYYQLGRKNNTLLSLFNGHMRNENYGCPLYGDIYLDFDEEILKVHKYRYHKGDKSPTIKGEKISNLLTVLNG